MSGVDSLSGDEPGGTARDGVAAVSGPELIDAYALRRIAFSAESETYRDEACRHVVAQPYADNRYVRLLDDLRALLDAHPEPREGERAGWVSVSCEVADAIRLNELVKPSASKIDMDGTYGEPEVYTEWAACYPSGREVPVLREHRWPNPLGTGGDVKPCEHYAPKRAQAPGAGEGGVGA